MNFAILRIIHGFLIWLCFWNTSLEARVSDRRSCAKQADASKVENTVFVEWKVRENEISKSSISLFPSFEVRTPASLNSFDVRSVAINIHAKSLALLIFKNYFFRHPYLKHKVFRWYSFKQWNSFFSTPKVKLSEDSVFYMALLYASNVQFYDTMILLLSVSTPVTAWKKEKSLWYLGEYVRLLLNWISHSKLCHQLRR